MGDVHSPLFDRLVWPECGQLGPRGSHADFAFEPANYIPGRLLQWALEDLRDGQVHTRLIGTGGNEVEKIGGQHADDLAEAPINEDDTSHQAAIAAKSGAPVSVAEYDDIALALPGRGPDRRRFPP